MSIDYEMKKDKITSKSLCNFKFEWIDINGKKQIVKTDDLELAQTIIGLLSREICLSDLEP